MLKKFVELLRQYKEILGAIVALVAGVFFVTDYFATKTELAILQCQMQNSIDLVDNNMKADQLARRIISLKSEASAQPSPAGKKAEIDLEIERLDRELAQADERRMSASRNLGPGACEKIVRGK